MRTPPIDLRPGRKNWTVSTETGAILIDTRKLRAIQEAYNRERAEAPALMAELRRHPAARRWVLACNHPRFQTWGALEALLEESRRETPVQPIVGEEWGHLAVAVAGHLDSSIYGSEGIEDLTARGWAYIGNALRVQFKLREAQEAFERSLSHLRRGTREPWEQAVWLDLKASLLRAQRRFDAAMRNLRRAMALFLAVGDRHRAGRTLINMENVLHRDGHPEQGIPLLHRALELIDPEQEPQLVFMAKHNLIDDLAEVGRYMEAQRLLIQSRPLYRRFDGAFTRNRCRWTEAKIARGLGQIQRAEDLLEAARAGFLEQEAAFEAALVSLELAGLFAMQGKIAEMKRLAWQMVPIFSSRQIHREALAAFQLWHQAVQSEGAEADMALRVAATLRRASDESQESL